MIRAAVVAGCALVLGLITAGRAAAHDLRPGVVSLRETAPGAFDLRLVAPIDSRGDVVEVTIELPPGCRRAGDRVGCDGDLAGTLAVRGMRGEAMRTLVLVQRLGGERAEWMTRAAAPEITLGPAPPRVWRPWLRLGVEHILGGLDHLAFVLGLLLVLNLAVDRRLCWSISAFTVGHSLTLALAVFGVVRVSIAPVEACIAASVVLVAREATHREPTLLRRQPWLAAGGFGLIHGLGFASALGQLELPRASLVWSLVWFNVGVELGQLAVVAAVVLAAGLARRLVDDQAWFGPRLHRAACYLLGSVAVWWLAQRVP